ncbi:MAG: cysteine hydrolase [Nitrososphaerota archaeon]|nr:cysteine hydrolase [Nitrososphaerota archaeon]MDG6923079.1 cysteine hydrolase [Nitrososphaerota archaeon]
MDALIVDDILHDFVYGKLKSMAAARIVPATKRILSAARRAKVPVIYVCDAHLPSDPEIKLWGAHAMKGTPGARVIDELRPKKGDYVLEKRVYSSFHDTGLDLLLMTLKVDTVVIVGLYSDICVRHSAADAFYRGYKIIIPRDCVESLVEGENERQLEYMKDTYNAKIATSEVLIRSWNAY